VMRACIRHTFPVDRLEKAHEPPISAALLGERRDDPGTILPAAG
jgi:hypothetical protein